MGTTPHRGAATATIAAGRSVVALYGPMLGGYVQNPGTVAEQGIAPLVTTPTTVTSLLGPLATYGYADDVPLSTLQPAPFTANVSTYGPPEILYVSLAGPFVLDAASGALILGGPVVALFPGQSFPVPASFPGDVWVASASAGHRFSAVIFQPATQYPPAPYAGAFPPSGPVTALSTIPSYLYKQYEDDDDLQALVAAQNDATQDYVDTFNALDLPDYTTKSGALLDWVGAGLYGLPRPTFFSGTYDLTGPLATVALADFPELADIQSTTNFEDVAVTSDDVYKRVLAWHLWKADGRQVSVPWLRRRVVRFLFGEAQQGGAAPVSVVSDEYRNMTVTIETGTRAITGGALFAGMTLGEVPFCEMTTTVAPNATPALAAVLKEGVDSGALEMPEQYATTVRIGLVGSAASGLDVLDLPQLIYT